MVRKITRSLAALVLTVLVSLGALACYPMTAYGADNNIPTLKAKEVEAKAGETVNLDVEIEHNPGILGATVEVNYDSRLTLTAIKNGEAFKALEMTKPGALAPGCRIHWDATELEDDGVKDGVMVTLTFAVAGDVEPGTPCFVSMSPVMTDGQADVFDRNLETVDLKGLTTNVIVKADTPTPLGSIADAEITVAEGAEYTGNAVTPKVTVVLDGLTLSENTDYTVKYANNTVAGTASVKVVGKGAFEGEKTVTFEIAKGKQTITASDVFVAMGKTASITAKSSGGGRLSYRSSNADIATVNASGVITPKSVGIATVTISADATTNYAAASREITVTVTQGSQTITASDLEVKAGEVAPINAGVSADGALTYSSADEGIATVDGIGLVRGVRVGTTTITIGASATANYGAASKAITVVVTQGAQTINASDMELSVGATATLDASTTGDGDLSYVSADPAVVAIAADGTLTAKSAGATTITINASETDSYTSASKTITVTVFRKQQTVVASDVEVKVGKTAKISASSSTGGSLTYTSEDEAIASVDDQGVVTGKSVGTVLITVKAPATGDYQSASKVITVTVEQGLQEITASDVVLKFGESAKLDAATSGDGSLTYVSADENIASVDESGMVKSIHAGSTTVTVAAAETDNYAAATKVVKVTVQKGKQTIEASDTTTAVGETAVISAKASSGGTLTYKSSNTKIATVNSAGVVTGRATGTVKITITAADTGDFASAEKTVTITVEKGLQTITASDKEVEVGKTVSLDAVAYAGGELSYHSSDTKIATVNAEGVVTGVSAGSATITIAAAATDNYEAVSKTVTITVTAAAAPENPFIDVFLGAGGTPHADDILWLASVGVTTGWKEADGTRTFRGEQAVVRQDMAAFLYRMAGSPAYVPSPADVARFKDVNSSTSHHDEIWWLASTGITTGWAEADGTRTFRGMETVKRQDMAAFLRRLTKYMGADYSLANGASNPFSDVSLGNGGTPHAEDILWLASVGVTTGWKEADGTRTYRGMADVIRQDMAAFLHRLDGHINKQ